jgi:hypothetical protein
MRTSFRPSSSRYLRVCLGTCLALTAAPVLPAAAQSTPQAVPPPPATLAFAGPQVNVEGKTIVAPGTRIDAIVADGATVTRLRPVVDGQEAEAGGPWKVGAHTAALTMVEANGRSTRTEPVPFVVDAEPPVLRWRTGMLPEFTPRAKEIEQTGRDRGVHRARRRIPPASSALIWTSGINWEPFPTDGQGLSIASQRPQVYFRSPGTRFGVEGASIKLEGQQVLWVVAEDAPAGVESLRLRWKPAPDGTSLLEVEARDNVGNVKRAEWPLSLPAPTPPPAPPAASTSRR